MLQVLHCFNDVCKNLWDAVGLHDTFIVGERAEGGLTIDVDRRARLLDRVAA